MSLCEHKNGCFFVLTMDEIKKEETNDKIVFSVKVSGFKEDEITIKVKDSYLIIEGKYLHEKEDLEEETKESEKKEIFRMIKIPNSVVSDSMKKEYSNNKLSIEFNKK